MNVRKMFHLLRSKAFHFTRVRVRFICGGSQHDRLGLQATTYSSAPEVKAQHWTEHEQSHQDHACQLPRRFVADDLGQCRPPIWHMPASPQPSRSLPLSPPNAHAQWRGEHADGGDNVTDGVELDELW